MRVVGWINEGTMREGVKKERKEGRKERRQERRRRRKGERIGGKEGEQRKEQRGERALTSRFNMQLVINNGLTSGVLPNQQWTYRWSTS